MSHACVAFGPKDSYLFSTSHGWRCKDLPPAILGLFTGPRPAKDFLEIVLGPDGSYAAVYEDQMGVRRFLGHDVAQDLENWVVGPGRDLDSLQIALGPNRAFFALDSVGAIWDELPEAFDNDIKSLLTPLGAWKYGKNPTSVSFGPDGDYVFITRDGCAGFHLNDDYPAALKKHVMEKQFFGLKNTCVILNPSRVGTYMILNGEGLAEGAFPPDCVTHFQAFSLEWKAFCQNAQIDATNAILEKAGSGARVPRVPVPIIPSSPIAHSPYTSHPSSPPPYTPYPTHFGSHSPAVPGRPLMQGLHQMSNSGSSYNGGSSGGYAGNFFGGGGGGGGGVGGSGGGAGNGTADVINNMINLSNSLNGGNGNGGDGTAAFLNSLVNASNSGNGGTDLVSGMLNYGNGGGGMGSGGFDPTSLLNTASLFDPTSIITSGLFS